MANVNFRMNNAGIRDIAKSVGMQNVLKEAAKSLADEANASANSHADWLYEKKYRVQPYAAGVTVARGTAIGYATTATSVGFVDEKRYKSLSTTNH